jgi:hypothetical protein
VKFLYNFVDFLGSDQFKLANSSQLIRRSLMLEQELMEQQARETGPAEILDFSLDFQVIIDNGVHLLFCRNIKFNKDNVTSQPKKKYKSKHQFFFVI